MDILDLPPRAYAATCLRFAGSIRRGCMEIAPDRRPAPSSRARAWIRCARLTRERAARDAT